jgi:hypothetical protein
MIEVYALVALVLVIVGVVLGCLAVMALGIHREERDHSMTVPTSDRVARGTRKVNGVYARIPGVIQESLKEPEAVAR